MRGWFWLVPPLHSTLFGVQCFAFPPSPLLYFRWLVSPGGLRQEDERGGRLLLLSLRLALQPSSSP